MIEQGMPLLSDDIDFVDGPEIGQEHGSSWKSLTE